MEQLEKEGDEALRNGETAYALECYTKLMDLERKGEYCSALAYCIAREKRAFKEAITLCNEAIRKDPKSNRHFLLLGRIYLLADRRKEAFRAFNLGLRHGPSVDIVNELKRLGMRKAPVLSFLRREHPINKYLGKLLAGWGFR
jgi:tetratricopeptide (TPR) repeat protein